ncbi:hypothetical protein [Allomuricauda sp. F6463D]|uniref:hypothetical protein n=1 Tax=Allomuricauda sp. F6463D TaxID=2926409 RepID=UPI001FF463CB|nr:hypothetical protein [Muricauda sp. F6463D]MCK0159224.1 hypothetical protein [Muricauda sp. F6463D]
MADELGINVQLLYKWRKWSNPNPMAVEKVKVLEESIEVKKLGKALKEKELELEILKKAVHIF